MHRLTVILVALGLALTAPPARAEGQGGAQGANGYFALVDEVKEKILTTPEFLDKIQNRNAENSPEEAQTLQKAWREMDQTVTWPIMSNPLSISLRHMLVDYGGMISSIVVLDDLGGVVAAWPKPLRYWHGDQDAFRETYAKGREGTYTARVSREWVTGSWKQYVARTLSLRGRRIGAVVVGIDIQGFAKQLGKGRRPARQ